MLMSAFMSFQNAVFYTHPTVQPYQNTKKAKNTQQPKKKIKSLFSKLSSPLLTRYKQRVLCFPLRDEKSCKNSNFSFEIKKPDKLFCQFKGGLFNLAETDFMLA